MARAAGLTRELEISGEEVQTWPRDSANIWNVGSGIWRRIDLGPRRARAQLGFRLWKDQIRRIVSRWHADDREKVRQAVNDAIQNRQRLPGEDFRLVRADGQPFFFFSWVGARGRCALMNQRKTERGYRISLGYTAEKRKRPLAGRSGAELEPIRQQEDRILEREVAEARPTRA